MTIILILVFAATIDVVTQIIYLSTIARRKKRDKSCVDRTNAKSDDGDSGGEGDVTVITITGNSSDSHHERSPSETSDKFVPEDISE
jgi:hypothetical protein